MSVLLGFYMSCIYNVRNDTSALYTCLPVIKESHVPWLHFHFINFHHSALVEHRPKDFSDNNFRCIKMTTCTLNYCIYRFFFTCLKKGGGGRVIEVPPFSPTFCPSLPFLLQSNFYKMLQNFNSDIICLFNFNVSDKMWIDNFIVNTDDETLPSMKSLQDGVTGKTEEDSEEYMSLVSHLMRYAVNDPGVSNPKEVRIFYSGLTLTLCTRFVEIHWLLYTSEVMKMWWATTITWPHYLDSSPPLLIAVWGGLTVIEEDI